MTDDELDDASRAVLEICRDGDRLPDAVRHAVWQRLEHGLAPPPVVRSSRWIWIGVAAAAAAVLAVALGRTSVSREQPAARELAPLQRGPGMSPQTVESNTPPARAPEPATLPEIVAAPATGDAAVPPAEHVDADRAGAAARSGRAAGAEPPAAPREPGASELELVRAATAATRQGDAARALALLAEAQRRFGDGALLPERAAARVLALCADAQRSQARREADAFVARWPDSPLVARVRRVCTDDVTDGPTGGL